jgi:hypothetical protein
MTAWQWLRAEIERRLGPEGAAELWREYWERYALDQAQKRISSIRERNSRRARSHAPLATPPREEGEGN